MSASDDRDRDSSAQRRESTERRISARVWMLVALALLIVLFGVDNRHSVKVGYLFDEGDLPLVWVIVVSVVAGGLLERAYVFVAGRRRRHDG